MYIFFVIKYSKVYMKINIIVAYADNYVIGNDGTMVWDYPEITEYFHNITCHVEDKSKKNIIIMGYNSYLDYQPKVLSNRINIVITTKNLELQNEEDLYYVDSLGSSIELCNKLENVIEKIFVIGGDQIYSYFLKSFYYKYLDKVYITRIHKKYEGNKFFYGLEEKFYYLSVTKSELYPELEYRILQYDSDFISPEITYLKQLQRIMKNGIETEFSKDLGSFTMNINLSYYFPLFSICKKKYNELFNLSLISMNIDKIKLILNNLIINIKNREQSPIIINFSEIAPFKSIYYFIHEDLNISCNIIHNGGNMLNEILNNIIFSSLLVNLIGKLCNLKPQNILYQCKQHYFLKSDEYIVDKIAWETPDVLPLLRIIDRDQQNISDFIIDDFEFLGLKI